MADQVLDARGLQCPMPVIKAKKMMDALQPGQVLLVQATDPGSKADFEAWTRSTGNALLSASQSGNIFSYEIQKKG